MENEPKDLFDLDYASPSRHVRERWRYRVFYGFCAANIATGLLAALIVTINRTRPPSAAFIAIEALICSVVIFVASWLYLMMEVFIFRTIKLNSIPILVVCWMALSTLELCFVGVMAVGLLMFMG